MCGFAGVIGYPVTDNCMRVAGMSLRHRGPDDFGIYQDSDIGLVHTRLSIIDPSPAGHQPMVDLESGVVIVYNGEIYNHKALAKEVTGKKRISQTDTEVFLRLYLKYGLNCLRKLRGMFAFAIWDPRTKSLHLGRDRLGIKPLFFHQRGKTIFFGSEIRALGILGVDMSADLSSIKEFLETGRMCSGQRTFFDKVSSVLPGSSLTFADGVIKTEKYWTGPQIEEASIVNLEEIECEIRNSIAIHLISDRPIGLSLSSGIDSALLLDQIGKLGHDALDTFTFGFDEKRYDEIRRVDKCNFPIQLNRHNVVIKPSDVIEGLETAVTSFEAPLPGLGAFAGLKLCQAAKNAQVPVLLSGEGADEIFAGYEYYREVNLLNCLAEGEKSRIFNKELDAYCRLRKLNRDEVMHRVKKMSADHKLHLKAPDGSSLRGRSYLHDSLRDIAAPVDSEEYSGYGLLRGAMTADLLTLKVPKLLWYQDRASMASGIEVRVPFLDHKLIDVAYAIPSNQLIRGGF